MTEALTERQKAEQEYTVSAFYYERDPVGSRDWELFWKGWQARASLPAVPPLSDCDLLRQALEALMRVTHYSVPGSINWEIANPVINAISARLEGKP